MLQAFSLNKICYHLANEPIQYSSIAVILAKAASCQICDVHPNRLLHTMPAICKQQIEDFGRIVHRNWPAILRQLTGHKKLPCCFNCVSALARCCLHGLHIGSVQQQWSAILFQNCLDHSVTPACRQQKKHAAQHTAPHSDVEIRLSKTKIAWR